MKVSELIRPKKPVDDGTRAKVLKRITDLYDRGIPATDLLLHLRKEFGADMLKSIEEAIHHAPTSKKMRVGLAKLMKEPIPVETAAATIGEFLDDDALTDEFSHAETGSDARPIIQLWIQQNMPHLLTSPSKNLMGAGEGIFSPLHGYDL